MISRRKFLRAGALFLPATAIGQIPDRRIFRATSVSTSNCSAVDFMRFGANGGFGWKGPAQMPGVGTSYYVNRVGGNLQAFTNSGSTWQWSRQPDFLSNWTQIRIACLMTIDQSAASITGMNNLFGMINNFSTVFNATNTNFIGFMMGGGAAWSRVPNNGRDYYASGANDRYCAKVINNSGTYACSSGSPQCFASDANSLSLIMVDLTKGSPNFTFQAWSIAIAQGMTAGWDYDDLNTILGAAGGADIVIKGVTFQRLSGTVAFTETNALDTVAIYSGPAAGTNTSVYAVGVRKIS